MTADRNLAYVICAVALTVVTVFVLAWPWLT